MHLRRCWVQFYKTSDVISRNYNLVGNFMKLFEEADAALLPDFKRHWIEVNGENVLALTAGEGEPLLLLHGDPQTHLCWHRVVPDLIKRFSVVLTDIRGRGEGYRPGYSPNSEYYSKRNMAAEQLAVMKALGHSSFSLVGHDRGARVARRLALDHPAAVRKLVLLDIVPAINLYERYDADLAQQYFYFNFLTQPSPLPEQLISGDPDQFMRQILFGLTRNPPEYEQLALSAYLASATRPDAIAAMCECFRAGFHIDRDHDREDRLSGRSIECPTLICWGEQGVIGKFFDMREVWREWCADPSYLSFPCGHFIPEEVPELLNNALSDFLDFEQ